MISADDRDITVGNDNYLTITCRIMQVDLQYFTVKKGLASRGFLVSTATGVNKLYTTIWDEQCSPSKMLAYPPAMTGSMGQAL